MRSSQPLRLPLNGLHSLNTVVVRSVTAWPPVPTVCRWSAPETGMTAWIWWAAKEKVRVSGWPGSCVTCWKGCQSCQTCCRNRNWVQPIWKRGRHW